MDGNVWNLFATGLFLFTTIVALVLISIVFVVNKRKNIGDAVNAAVDGSMFSPTRFVIYDRSTETKCDRLITILPFEWYLWAVRDELYILNPEGVTHCERNMIPVVQVIDNTFKMTCINLELDTLLKHYKENGVTKIVNYEITGKKFTIMTALNILVKDWVTYDTKKMNLVQGADNQIYEINDPVLGVRLTEATDLNSDEGYLFDRLKPDKLTRTNPGRQLTSHEVLKLMSNESKHRSHTELLDKYQQHVKQSPRKGLSRAKHSILTR